MSENVTPPKTILQLDRVYSTFESVIDMLDDKSLNELAGGYQSDVDRLMKVIEEEVVNIIEGVPEPVTQEKFYNLTNVSDNIHESLKVLNYNYFKVTMLPEFYIGSLSIEWGNIIQIYDRTCTLAARGLGKCEIRGTQIVMYDGTLKKIEDIVVGDLVMGTNSTPRTVINTHSGIDDLYEIKQSHAINYTVNSHHILHFKRGKTVKKTRNGKSVYETRDSDYKIIEMSAKEFHQKSDYWKSKSFGYRVKGWDLPEKEQSIDPYFLGLWLGDGSENNQDITSIDDEITEYLIMYARKLGIGFRSIKLNRKITDGCSGKRNKLLTKLKELNLLHNKHIPNNYLLGSREQRLQLLAGLIDTDGTVETKHKKSFSITQKRKYLLEQIQQLCWSLGFNASLNEVHKKLKYKNNEIYTSYDLYISGDVWDIPTKIKRKQIEQFDRVQDSQKSKLSSEYVGKGEYFGIEINGDNLYLLKDGTVIHNTYEFDMAMPIWKMYGYRKPTDFNPIDLSIARRREGLIVTNKFELGRKILGNIAREIKENNQLWERLKPQHHDEGVLGRERIETKNGCEINLRSAESSSRGLHPDWIVVDDYGDQNWIYSQSQRNKAIDNFYGDIMKTIERGGTINVVGTPFHEKDLYAHIRENDPSFKYFEYPAIFPDGTIVAPHRWNLKELKQEYETNGSLIFSREILVLPISDNSTIFPWAILEKSFIGMQDYRLVYNRDSFPIKFKYVSVGCDFAISANVGSDSTVFSVWGIDQFENYWLLYVWRKSGAGHNEQISKLKEIERSFSPDEIVAESNGFQKIMLSIGKEHGIKNITDFNTTSWNKKDLYEGLPSMAILFEQGRIKFPRGDQYSKEMTDWLCSEFNSITIKPDSGRLESAGEHDDGVLSAFFAIKCIGVNKNKQLNFVMV